MKWISRPLGAEAGLQNWLRDSGSLTARIRARLGGFSLCRLAEGRGIPHADEKFFKSAHIRDVLLLSHGKPVVYAHSVLGAQGLSGPWRSVGGLGGRPLGEALFSDPKVSRHPLEFRKIGRNHPLYRKACAHLSEKPAHLWARRSLFFKQGSPLLVTEVFLPGILS